MQYHCAVSIYVLRLIVFVLCPFVRSDELAVCCVDRRMDLWTLIALGRFMCLDELSLCCVAGWVGMDVSAAASVRISEDDIKRYTPTGVDSICLCV